MKNKSIIPLIILLTYIILFIWSSINPPAGFDVFIVEAITSIVTPLILLILYIKNIRFSNTAYILASIFPLMHIIGAHYTFTAVPFDWFNNLIGSERNMYDRVAHFSVGLYAYMIIEGFIKYKLSNRFIAYSYALFFIIALAGVYELFEWWYAVSVNPEAGIEVLGSQGDIWDAQKDILMDTLGAVTAMIIYFVIDKFNFNKK